MQDLVATDSNFQAEVLDSKGLTLVDFWAVWCYPCQILGPIIEELAGEWKESVKVMKFNVDENPQVSMKYNVMSIPTVMLFKDGKLVETLIGVQPKSVYQQVVEKYTK